MFDEIDVYVLFSEVNRFYFTQQATSSGCVILAAGERVFITDFRYIEAARKALVGWKVVAHTKGLLSAVEEEVARLSPRTIGFEDEYMTVATFAAFKEIAGSANLIPVSKKLSKKRAIKTEDEISKIAASQIITQKAFTKVSEMIKPGITEREMAAELVYEMQMLGAEGTAFDVIVAFGANSAMPHYKPSARRLEKNDIILVDMGAKYNGYCSDMSRTFCLGDAGKQLTDLHQLVLEAQLYVIKSIKAGVTGREADTLVREFFMANGYEKEFGHSLGHGVGIEIHENPKLSRLSEDVLEPNMIITIEPGLYVEGVGGVRIEDMIVVKETGSLNLTNANKNLNI